MANAAAVVKMTIMDASEHNSPNAQRRSFFAEAIAILSGAICGLVPFVAGLVFLTDPLLRKEKADVGDGFLPLDIGPDALPTDGTPLSVKIMADRTDAWNVYPDQPIGSVWLRKNATGEVVVFNTTCPHLGCYVDYRSGQQDFFCPCHTSTFDLEGNRLNQIPPRNMDNLDVEIRDGKLWVKFENFRGATPDKIPV